jgi:lipoate---protein ligase
MLCLILRNTDPNYCLAAEEFLLKNYKDDIFMLWQSHDTVVVGKHQNAMGEIDYRYVRENGIKVARRISGGGTVYHDKGNVNFTFIKNVAGPQEISFKRFTQPIVNVLATLGVNAVTSGRNDLLVDGLKISGNAEHVFKNRVLHHGTLLYNSDLKNLGNAIRVVPGKYTGKAVQSNRSVVVNIAQYLDHQISVEEFIALIMKFQLATSSENLLFAFSPGEEKKIRNLVVEKFGTREWQFGYSPMYRFSQEKEVNGKILKINLEVEKGKIQHLEIEGDYYSEIQQRLLIQNIPGTQHEFEAVKNLHQILGIQSDDELLYCWF